MLGKSLKQLSSYQRKIALEQAAKLGCQDAKIVDNALVSYSEYPGDESYLALYKCGCGALIAEDEEYGELGACYKCNANYLGLDE